MDIDGIKKMEVFKLPRQVLISAILVFAMGAIVSSMLWHIWNTREDYAFGFMMPLFSLFVIYDRRAKIFSYFYSDSGVPAENALLRRASNLFFGAMLMCGFITWIFFAVLDVLAQGTSAAVFPMTFGFSFAAFAIAYFAGEKDSEGRIKPLKDRLAFTMLFLFPCFAWIISAPMFHALETAVSLFLLSKVAVVVTEVMSFLGYIVELKGNIIIFPGGSVGVADACSGIRSLTACLFAGSFLSAVFLDKFWKKALLVGCSMACAFFNNLLRSLFLSFWAYHYGPDAISGFVHDAAGYVILIMTIIELLLLLPLFMLNPIPAEFRKKPSEISESSDQENGD